MKTQRGLLIFAPCGSGKSYFLEKYGHALNAEDGDAVLEQADVKNRNYFWYGPHGEQQESIRKVIESYLTRGVHILYSGNPLAWTPDLIVYIDPDERRRRVDCRQGFVPTKVQFDREEEAYTAAMRDVVYLRDFDSLKEYLQGLIK